jgi:hypothetical protein
MNTTPHPISSIVFGIFMALLTLYMIWQNSQFWQSEYAQRSLSHLVKDLFIAFPDLLKQVIVQRPLVEITFQDVDVELGTTRSRQDEQDSSSTAESIQKTRDTKDGLK